MKLSIHVELIEFKKKKKLEKEVVRTGYDFKKKL